MKSTLVHTDNTDYTFIHIEIDDQNTDLATGHFSYKSGVVYFKASGRLNVCPEQKTLRVEDLAVVESTYKAHQEKGFRLHEVDAPLDDSLAEISTALADILNQHANKLFLNYVAFEINVIDDTTNVFFDPTTCVGSVKLSVDAGTQNRFEAGLIKTDYYQVWFKSTYCLIDDNESVTLDDLTVTLTDFEQHDMINGYYQCAVSEEGAPDHLAEELTCRVSAKLKNALLSAQQSIIVAKNSAVLV